MANKKTASELTVIDIVSEISKMLPAYIADYIYFLYAPECLSYEPVNYTFEELQRKSKNFPLIYNERTAKQWLLDETVQKALKLLLSRKNTQQLNELHFLYAKRAQESHFDLRALLELNKQMFDGDSENDLIKLLNAIPADVGGDDD